MIKIRNNDLGFGLIEVMIAAVVVSIVGLSLITVQRNSRHASKQLLNRYQVLEYGRNLLTDTDLCASLGDSIVQTGMAGYVVTSSTTTSTITPSLTFADAQTLSNSTYGIKVFVRPGLTYPSPNINFRFLFVENPDSLGTYYFTIVYRGDAAFTVDGYPNLNTTFADHLGMTSTIKLGYNVAFGECS